MENGKKEKLEKLEKKEKDVKEEKERVEHKIDAELNDSFPASDPPSYSQPGNDDIKD